MNLRSREQWRSYHFSKGIYITTQFSGSTSPLFGSFVYHSGAHSGSHSVGLYFSPGRDQCHTLISLSLMLLSPIQAPVVCEELVSLSTSLMSDTVARSVKCSLQ